MRVALNMNWHSVHRPTKSFVAIIFLFFTTGCWFDGKVWLSSRVRGHSSISGTVLPLSPAFKSQSVQCNSPKAHLYALSSTGEKTDPAIMTVDVAADGQYRFEGLRSKNIEIAPNRLSSSLLIEVSGCDQVLSRLVTGPQAQNISDGSSLLWFLSNSPSRSRLGTAPVQRTSELHSLLSQLENYSSFNAAYNILSTQPELSETFEAIFEVKPEVLTETAPFILNSQGPPSLREKEAHTFSVSAFHWSTDYKMTYLWKMGNDVIGTTANLNFIPGADHQGQHAIVVYIGYGDGVGQVDLTKPYVVKTWLVSIENNVPPEPPLLIRTSPEYTNSPNVTLQLATGAQIDDRPAHCHSFSSLALTEDDAQSIAIPPISAASYNLDCTTSPTQNLSVTLSGQEGRRALRLWARDSSGNISATPQEVSVVYDATAPVLQWVDMTPGQILRGGTDFSIRWESQEANKGAVSLEYTTNGGTTWNFIASNQPDNGLYEWTLPTVDTTDFQIRLTATDLAGNSSSLTSPTMIIDSTPPSAPLLSLQTPSVTNQLSVTVKVQNCNDISHVLLSESSTSPSVGDSNWQTCSTTLPQTITLSPGDGNRTIYAFAKDEAGHISTATNLSVFVDQTPPTVLLQSPQGGEIFSGNTQQVPAINTQTITYTATDAGSGLTSTPITISFSTDAGATWSAIASNIANTGSYLWTVPEINSDSVRVSLQACDQAGNCTHVQSSTNLTIDSSPPTAQMIKVNNGSLQTDNFYVTISLDAQDNLSGVSSVCLLKTAAAPSDSDPCWSPVSTYGASPGQSISFDVTGYLLGFSPSFFNIRVYYKDSAGNISANTGTLNQDFYVIQYDPGQAPVISALTALNDDSITTQPTSAQTTFAGGQAVYIKWHVSDDKSLPSGSISLYYTTDEVNFTQIASGLDNIANGGCTIDGTTFTGCYHWTSPGAPNGYFKIRLEVTDTSSIKTLSSTPPLNVPSFKVIAGNTDAGLGGSARSAVLYSEPGNENGDPNSLVIDKNGIFYFKDYKRGIMKIDPTTGLLTMYLPKTGVYSGEGGPATSATLINPARIGVDSKDRLYIYDYKRIVRVDTDGKIRTLIGGGSSTADGSFGTDYNLESSHGTFIIAPNDDLYFTENRGYTPNDGFRLKLYKASDGRVYSIHLRGTGVLGNPNETIDDKRFDGIGLKFKLDGTIEEINARVYRDITGGRQAYAASFDPATGLSLGAGSHRPLGCVNNYGGRDVKFQSPKGDLYTFNEICRRVYKLNPDTNTWTPIFGSGTSGRCPDGTAALSCANGIDDVFVDSNDQLYILDNGMIRTLVNGQILTLFGQPLSAEDATNPLAIRFPEIQQIAPSADNKIVINDHISGYLWEAPRSGDIVKLAGNGTSRNPRAGRVASQSEFASADWAHARPLAVHPVNNNIYLTGYNTNGCPQLIFLNRASGNWENFHTSCNTNYWDADGTSDSKLTYIGWSILGFDSDLRLLASTIHWSGTQLVNNVVKAFADGTGIQSHFIGVIGPSTGSNSYPSDGTDMSTATVFPQHAWGAQIGFHWDAENSRWLGSTSESTRIVSIPSVNGVAGSLSTLTYTSRPIRAFTYRKESGNPIIYYCATDGRIYRRDVSAGTETALAWPSPTISCSKKTMSINHNLNKLEFIFTQNGLYGVAEMDLPTP